jgi:hypothetical protein
MFETLGKSRVTIGGRRREFSGQADLKAVVYEDVSELQQLFK